MRSTSAVFTQTDHEATAYAAQATSRNDEVRQAWGEYLFDFAWDHFATLTFDHEASPETVLREVRDRWIRRVSWKAQRPLAYAFVVESGSRGGRAHAHPLVAGTASVPTSDLERAWKKGHTHIRRYDPARGAAFYLTKNVTCDGRNLEIELSTQRAPRRQMLAAT